MAIVHQEKFDLPAPANDGAKLIVDLMPRIARAMGSGVDRQKLATAIVVAANECDMKGAIPETLAKAAFHAALVNLPPGKPFDFCYFIPRAPKKGELKRFGLEFGYKGYLELAFRNQYLESIHTEVVCEEELATFRYYNDENGPHLWHDVSNWQRNPTRSNVKAAYCVYRVRAGGIGIELVRRNEIDAAMPPFETEPWKHHFAQMCRKSAVKRSAKSWRCGEEFRIAMLLDDQLYSDQEQNIPGHSFNEYDTAGRGFKLADIADEDTDGDK